MKKASIILGILLFLCVAVLPMETQAATEGYLTYTIKDGEVTITDCDEDASGKIVIPDTIEDYPVTEIKGYAFSQCDSITSITVPAGVKEIGTLQCVAPIWVNENNPNFISDSKGALYSKDMKTLFGVPASLTGVYMVPDGVQTIETRAFATCENLTQIILPESITVIEAGAFAWCTKLESINIPAGVKDLGGVSGYMFIKCSSLKSIAIPEGVTAIPESTFTECTSLESVELPHTVTFIGFEAFLECASLRTIDLSHVTEIEESAFQMCTSLSGKLVLAEGLTKIDIAVFANCFNLEEVVLPESLTEIGGGAFFGCQSLKELYIPAGVTSFGENSDVQMAFRVAEENPNYISDSYGVLYNKGKTQLIGAPRELSGHYTIPDGVTELSYKAFSGCKNLTGVDIPDSVTTFGSHAFSYSGLTEVPAFKNVTVLDSTFQGCTGFTSVTVPEGVMEISTYAFEDCTSMTKIVLPASLKKIGVRAFQDCAALQEVISCANKDTIEIDNFGEANDYLLNAKWTSHTWTNRKIVLKPTCTAIGQEKVYCSTCEQTKIVPINVLAHNYTKSYFADATNHGLECVSCGDQQRITHHMFWNGVCSYCEYKEDSSLANPSTSTQIPKETNGQTQLTPEVQQAQQSDSFVIIVAIVGVAVLIGAIVAVILVKKKQK